jgi:hypothetical protein
MDIKFAINALPTITGSGKYWLTKARHSVKKCHLAKSKARVHKTSPVCKMSPQNDIQAVLDRERGFMECRS